MRPYIIKKKKRFRNKKVLLLAAIITLTVSIYLFMTLNVNPVLKTVSEEKVRALTTVAVNSSAQKVMGESFNYSDIIQITTDSNGDISLIQVNTPLINTIARKTVLDSQTIISEMGEQGIKVPIGSLSGMTIFAGKGPEVNIKVYPVGSVSSVFESSFISSGINQTRHTVKMIVTSKVNVVVPGTNRTISTETDVILCENIIIGKIPDVYLQSTNVSEMLDLIPR